MLAFSSCTTYLVRVMQIQLNFDLSGFLSYFLLHSDINATSVSLISCVISDYSVMYLLSTLGHWCINAGFGIS